MILQILSHVKNKKTRIMSKRDYIKHVVSSKFKVTRLKRPSLTRIKTRILIFSGSIILTVVLAFNVSSARASSPLINIQTEEVEVHICLRRDVLLENRIIDNTITENIYTDSIIGRNVLMERGLMHTVEINESSIVKDERPKKKPNSGPSRKIYTIADLPKRQGDTIIVDELRSIPRYDFTNEKS